MQIVAHVWSTTRPQTLQMRETFPAFGVLHNPKPSKCEKLSSRLEYYTASNSPNARNFPHVWSSKPRQTLQMRDDACMFGVPNMQALPHRFAFSRYALSEKARQCDTPACAQAHSEYSSYSVRKAGQDNQRPFSSVG